MTDNSTRSKDKSVNAKKFKIWSLQFLRFKAVTLLIRSCVHLLKLCHWQKYILLTFFGKKGQPKPKRGSLPADARETQHPKSLNRAIFKSGEKKELLCLSQVCSKHRVHLFITILQHNIFLFVLF